MNAPQTRPIIGISIGDINGIGPELIVKTFADGRMTELCTPVLFGNNKVLNFYRKTVTETSLNFNIAKDLQRLNPKQLNILNCWEEEVAVTPGEVNEVGGRHAILSLQAAATALKDGQIHALVTAPIHKRNTHHDDFPHAGHTPYLKSLFGAQDVLMLMVSGNMRMGLLSEHIPLSDVAANVTRERILSKLRILRDSLKKDFGIDKPRVAVLGLNPHAGDDGLAGREEIEVIKPALAEMRKNDLMAFGPYSPDAFFAQAHHERFDAVLAMYHDQGLIPFKSLSTGEGVNYTAGLAGIRTSPDHGPAMDIAGKASADESSFRESIFTAIDIFNRRMGYAEARRNPLRKMAAHVVGRIEDERIHEDS